MKGTGRWASAVLAGLLWAAGAGAAAAEEALVVARDLDIRTLDPQRQYEITPPMIMHATYENLVTFQGADYTKVVPFLAERFEISRDGLTYTFRLRPNVKFHTGNTLTAEDVRFSFERLRNLKDNPAWLMDVVKRVEAADARTVRITLTEPNAAFLSMLVSPNFAVVDSKAVKARGGTDAADAKTADKATEWLDQHSAGTGPFVLKGWTRGVEVVLERNPSYWRKPAALSRVVVKQVPDPATQRMMVGRGDIDVAQNLDADLIESVKKEGKARVVEGSTMDIFYFAVTTSAEVHKELADRKVRQAIAAAIDYDGIIHGLMKGAAVRPPSVIPLGLLGADAALAAKRDLNRAKALMKEAGQEKGFSVRLVYGTGTWYGLSRDTLAQKLASDLGAIGVKVELEPREVTAWRGDFRAGKLAMTIADWTPDFLDPHGWAVPFAVKGEAAAKRVHYDNPEAGKAAQEAARVTDPARRAPLYRQVQQLLIADAAFVNLIQPKTLIAIRPTVSGYVYNPVWGVDFYPIAKAAR